MLLPPADGELCEELAALGFGEFGIRRVLVYNETVGATLLAAGDPEATHDRRERRE
ncbi:MAG: hypothetical protein ABUL64_02385 [Singulisphaera sp.]